MKICMRWCAALALAAGLAGCAGGRSTRPVLRLGRRCCGGGGRVNEGASSGSGITVFGDIDVGVSRVR